MRLPASIPGLRWADSVLDAARRATLGRLGAGLLAERTAAGTSLRRSGERPFFAKLVSGSGGGPYTFRRAAWVDGVWVERVSGDDPATAYEANLIHPGVPRIVRMIPSGLAGEYRFVRPREGSFFGCPCPLPAADLTFRLARWYPKFCAVTDPSYLKSNCALYVDLPPIDIPLSYVGPGGLWESDYFLISWPDEPGFGSFDFLKRAPRKLVVSCDDGEISVYMRLYDHDTGSDPGPGIHFIDPPPEGTESCPLEGLAPSGSFTESCVFAEILPSASVKLCRWTLAGIGCDPLCAQFQFNCTASDQPPPDVDIDPGRLETYYLFDPAVGLPETSEVCVTAYEGGCVETGTPAVGLTVDLYERGGLTPVATGTTNGSGQVCFTGLPIGAYTAKATLGGCPGEVDAYPPCGGTAEVDLFICCAEVSLRVTEFGSDPEDPVLIPGSTVTLEGHTPVVVGMDATAAFALTAAEMRAFGFGGAGTDCSLRRVGPFTITSPTAEGGGETHLYRCGVYIDVACGDSASEDVTLRPFPAYTRLPLEAHPSCCGPYDCEEGDEDGLAWTDLDVIFDWEFRNTFTGASIPGYGPQTWSGVMLLDQANFEANGGLLYKTGCLAVANLVILCDEEPSVTYNRMKLELLMCQEGTAVLTATFYPNTDCSPGSGEGECPSCSGNRVVLTLVLGVNPAMGAEDEVLCPASGGFMDSTNVVGGGGSGHCVFFNSRFRAAGRAA